MRASTNASSGSAQFSMKISKREDGRFEGVSPSVPSIKPVVADTEREVALGLKKALEFWVTEGCRHG